MLLSYVDESFTKDRYYIAALLVHDAKVAALSSALDEVVTEAAYAHGGLALHAELHGHDLVAGKHDWARLAPKIRVRIGVYGSALAAIAEHADAVIFRGVDVARLKARYRDPDHPHSIVLTHLLERIDQYAEHRNEYALMIADEVAGQANHRRSLWTYQKGSTWGYRSRQITRVVDTIHFAPSDASRLVQGADLLAHLHRRQHAHVETDPRAERANAELYARIEPLIEHSGCWYP